MTGEKRTVFDYARLKGRTRERGLTQEQLAAAAGIKEATYSQKINNNSEFKQREILDICAALGIDHSQIHSYFFTQAV